MSEDITKGFFPESDNDDSAVKGYIKGSEFDGEGLKLEVVGMEVYTPKKGENGEDYGAKHTYGAGGVITKENYLIKEGILKEGETFKYKFKQDGVERNFDNSSVGFSFAVKNAGLKEGDIVTIKRNKKSNFDIKWLITKE